jgi:peptidoglycan/xylan/chitin deacetylase (PgdA/CDA1 family)
MRCVASAAFAAWLLLGAPAYAARCPGNPHALGTSRVLSINPQEYGRIGKMQYSQFPQLPLNDREVVLTFDDGPLPPYTEHVLKALAAECVKATFFSVGRQANQFPDLLRRVVQEGHTVGSHSQNHPLTFDQMPFERAKREIEDGLASVGAALGDPRAVAPFFRIPGLLRIAEVEDYLASKGIAIWSADADADDWYRVATPESVVRKAMTRLGQRGRGVLLLHDIQPVTALALPMLLRELKANGYRVVQVVPQGNRQLLPGPRVASALPDAQGWPRTVSSEPERTKSQRHKRRSRTYVRYDWRGSRVGFDDWNYRQR